MLKRYKALRKAKKRIDKNGLQFHLYLLFIFFVVVVLFIIAISQLMLVKKMARDDVKQQLQITARNISSTYGTDAYMKAIRSVLYSQEYLVRTITEDGTILVDMNELSYFISWPEIDLDLDGIVYVQLVANWSGSRELLFIATDMSAVKEMVKDVMMLFLFIASLVLVIAFWICWIIAKTYLKTIYEITDCAKALSAGDYSVNFPKNSYTEINVLSEALECAVDEMAEYEQIRRDMIANISHDMRTPLTMIKAYAEMIQLISGNDPQKREEHIKVIISQVDKLSAFVTGSLELGKLQAKTVRMDMRRFSLASLVRVHMTNIMELDNGRHEFKLFLSEDSYVYADSMRIGQIIDNLVNNSMKYGKDPIELYVTNDNNIVRLEVKDYGAGIPQDKLHHVWTKYYRVNPYGEDSGSAGLGLSIIKEIADMHGLNYGVDSQCGCGTFFWFDFKYCKE